MINVVFKKMSLEDNIRIVYWDYFDDGKDLDVHARTIECFPELANIDKSMSKEEIESKIAEVVTKTYRRYEKILDESAEQYTKAWKPYNDKYLELLSNYFNCSFPDEVNEIVATVGLIPVCPRYLDTFSFSIVPQTDKVVDVTAHEILHFMWFLKWKQIHPETPRRNYDSPYLEWKYSEMVTDPILNNKPFNELFNFEEKGYDSFYELYDGDTLVMDKLRDIYSTNDNVEDKINNGFNYIKTYFNEEIKTKK